MGGEGKVEGGDLRYEICVYEFYALHIFKSLVNYYNSIFLMQECKAELIIFLHTDFKFQCRQSILQSPRHGRISSISQTSQLWRFLLDWLWLP